jgi:hypothetical protein
MSYTILLEFDKYPEKSLKQKKRFDKVIRQLNEVWDDTILQMKFIHSVDIMRCNNLMIQLHKIYFIVYRNKIEYYHDKNIQTRKQRNYISRKINKLKYGKYEL